MHLSKDDIPVKINAPGAIARQIPDFGIASGAIGAEHFTMSAGTDLAPLLKGLAGDACQAAHWGYMITGDVVVTYSDGAVPNTAPQATSSTGPRATAFESTATPS